MDNEIIDLIIVKASDSGHRRRAVPIQECLLLNTADKAG